MKLTGRRRFIQSALVGDAIIHAELFAATTKRSPTIRITKSTDDTFDQVVASHFPDAKEIPKFAESVKPFAAIIKNDTDLTAKAYSVNWTLQYADGKIGSEATIAVQRHTMPKPAAQILRPGQVRLLSPAFNVAPTNVSLIAAVCPIQNIQRILGAELDGVVFEDGTFSGPNQTNLKLIYVSTRHAEHDAAVAINELMRSGAALDRVIETLVAETLFSGSHYWDARAVEARLLLHLYQSQGVPALQKDIVKRLSYAKEPILLRIQ